MRDKSIRTHRSTTRSVEQKRRTRSQSRNYRVILSNQDSSAVNAANKLVSTPTTATRRFIPFDLFLINLRYNKAYTNEAVSKSNFEISKLIEEFLTAFDENTVDLLDQQEKLLLNSQNIQIFLEQLCPHKRHIKLDNLKSINLNNNRIKK